VLQCVPPAVELFRRAAQICATASNRCRPNSERTAPPSADCPLHVFWVGNHLPTVLRLNMDPIGVIGFIVDNAERLKRALDQVGAQATSPQLSTLRQVRANDEAIDSLTHQVATSLEDLEEIFDGLRAPASSGQPMPAGLEKDLNRMKSSMAQSADCLLRMSPVRSKQQTTRIRQLFAKGKQLKIREEVSAELRRVDGDMQGLLQRFTVGLCLHVYTQI
jgi:hypothetical protein